MSDIKAIIFDIDGTLIEESEVLQDQADAVAWKFGQTHEAQQKLVTTFFAVNSEEAAKQARGEANQKNDLSHYFRTIAKRLSSSLSNEECARVVNDWRAAFGRAQNHPTLFPDALPTLKVLKDANYELYIASGSTIENRQALLDQLNISNFFSNIFAAGTIGFQKQDKRFWHEVLDALPYQPSEIAVVGNQLNDDILHPQALEMHTVLIERQGSFTKQSNQTAVTPAHTVRSLEKVYSLVQSKPLSVCCVLNSVTLGTHSDYVLEMYTALAANPQLDITVLFEVAPEYGVVPDGLRTRVQQWRFAPLRILELSWLLLQERWRGTKTFYVHYSFAAALVAGIITRVTGGTVYYWNAGMPWLYHRSWYVEWYQKLTYRLIDFLVTGADELHDGYQRIYGLKPEQIVTIPNWVELQQIRPAPTARAEVRQALGITDDAPIVLFVHKLAKRKGADLLIPTFEALHGKYHFVIAGDGPLLPKLQSYQSDRWHVLGRVDRERVHQLLQVADVFFMPSEEEGSPHSLIEAMAYRVPFVASRVGGVPSTVPPDLRTSLVGYGDISGYASNIEELLTNPTVATKAKTAVAKWMYRFDKEKAVTAFTNLLTDKEKQSMGGKK